MTGTRSLRGHSLGRLFFAVSFALSFAVAASGCGGSGTQPNASGGAAGGAGGSAGAAGRSVGGAGGRAGGSPGGFTGMGGGQAAGGSAGGAGGLGGRATSPGGAPGNGGAIASGGGGRASTAAGGAGGSAGMPMACMAAGACDPFSTMACASPQQCIPGSGSGTKCATLVNSILDEGQSCPDAATNCKPGLMCGTSSSGLVCQRMCPKGSIGFCGPTASCAGLIADPCIQTCVPRALPCDIYSQDCSATTDACTFATDAETGARYTGCAAAGPRQAGETCSNNMGACGRGLVCVGSVSGAATCHKVCKPAAAPACDGAQTCTGLSSSWMVTYCQ